MEAIKMNISDFRQIVREEVNRQGYDFDDYYDDLEVAEAWANGDDPYEYANEFVDELYWARERDRQDRADAMAVAFRGRLRNWTGD
jgi:hypothetical protein